jgi:hypothetical protein
MSSGDDRAHGVTPGLRQDYATRTASHRGAFVLPYLRRGMNLPGLLGERKSTIQMLREGSGASSRLLASSPASPR